MCFRFALGPFLVAVPSLWLKAGTTSRSKCKEKLTRASLRRGSRAKDKGKGKAVSFAREPTFLDRHRGDSDLSQSETEGQARRDGAARKRKDPPSPRPTRPAKRGWFGGGKTVRSEKLNLQVMPPDDGESFW